MQNLEMPKKFLGSSFPVAMLSQVLTSSIQSRKLNRNESALSPSYQQKQFEEPYFTMGFHHPRYFVKLRRWRAQSIKNLKKFYRKNRFRDIDFVAEC